MPFQVLPAEESDLPRITQIHFAAFEATSPMQTIMYATGVSEAILEDFAEGCAKDFHNDEVHYLKAVDEESGTIAAYAKWYIYKQERSREEWDQDHSYEGTLEGVNYDAINDFLGGIRESRRKIAKGSRHALLGVLCTDPAYFRRGVGTDLIKWGLEIADKEDLPSYLEASKFGHALYSRLGFEDLEVLTVDMKKYGWEGEGDGMYSTWIMKRETPVSEESVHEKMSIDAITN